MTADEAADPSGGDPSHGILDFVRRLRDFYGPLLHPPAEPFAFRLWQVLGGWASARGRDAAMHELRRIPAVTPDAVWGTAPGKLEAAVAVAGSADREQKVIAVREAAALFRSRRELLDAHRRPFRDALRTLRSAGLTVAEGEWLLLFAGEHRALPLDRGLCRVAARVGFGASAGPPALVARSARRELRRLSAHSLALLREVCFYFSHHASATCTEEEPRCGVCPLATRGEAVGDRGPGVVGTRCCAAAPSR